MTRPSWLALIAGTWLLGMAATARAGNVTYVYTDPQGTPLAEADAAGNITARFDYAPYGAASTANGMSGAPNGPGYTGHVNDPESGFVYMQARYYDPAVGRFLSRDPMAPASRSLFAVNQYDYANDNPIINMDPTGLFTEGADGWDGWRNRMSWQDSRCAFCIDREGTFASGADPSSKDGGKATNLKTVFVNAHLTDARKAAGDSGLTPAEILGVAALESHWGQARFAVSGNNYFGLHAPALYQIGTLPARQSSVRMAVFASFYDSARSFVNKNSYLNGI